MNTTFDEKIADALVKRRAGQFAFLKDLVAIDTAHTSADMAAAAHKTATMLERLGFEVERHSPPAEQAERAGLPGLTNLVVRARFGDGPVLGFVSHIDTAPPVDGWSIDPRAGLIRDGMLYGLGAVSGKGHLAAQAFAILALRDAGVRLRGTVELHISFDGNGGGALGAKWLLDEELVAPAQVIAGGPARAIATHAMGVLGISVDVRGRAAPAYAPEDGHDALEAASQALVRLYQVRQGLSARPSAIAGIGAPSMVIEHIEGGEAGAGVPDRVTFGLDRRLTPEEDPAQVETMITNLIGTTVARLPGARCRIRRTTLVPPMKGGEAVGPLQALVSGRLRAKLGQVPPARGVNYDQEGRHYAARGIPTLLYGAGPLDPVAAGMGGIDETLSLDDLRLATEVLAVSAVDALHGG